MVYTFSNEFGKFNVFDWLLKIFHILFSLAYFRSILSLQLFKGILNLTCPNYGLVEYWKATSVPDWLFFIQSVTGNSGKEKIPLRLDQYLEAGARGQFQM